MRRYDDHGIKEIRAHNLLKTRVTKHSTLLKTVTGEVTTLVTVGNLTTGSDTGAIQGIEEHARTYAKVVKTSRAG